ncbi:hypothetical protein [Vibrio lentus]|uniref:hypothetical protein n=1 Tax=Vibrio lentus TaxID=136468 RepID=UPI003D10A82B
MIININKIFSMLFLVIYFVVPKSLDFHIPGEEFSEIGNYLSLWKYQRIIIFCLCVFYLIVLGFHWLKKSSNSYNVSFFVLLFSLLPIFYFLTGYEVLYGLIGSITALVFIDNSRYNNFINPKYISIIFMLYIIQYLFYKVGGRNTSSFLDPNISGYYLFLIYCLLRAINTKYSILLALISIFFGVMSLSRNFILAVFLFELFVVFHFVFKEGLFKRLITGFNVSVLSVILVMVGSYYIAEYSSINDVITDSSERYLNIEDGSNYLRALANIDFFIRIMDGEFIFYGNGSAIDSFTSHRPHNAFFRAIYRYGLIPSLFMFVVFIIVFNRFVNVSKYSFALLLSVFAYYSILNDFITGPELVLLSIILTLINTIDTLKRSKNEN